MAENVTVADAIKQLRAQLEDAQREGVGKDLPLCREECGSGLGIVFKTEVEGGVGVKAWFLDISGKAKAGDEATHKVKLVLEPVGREREANLGGRHGAREGVMQVRLARRG